MRLLLVVCIAILVAVFLLTAWTAIASTCDLVMDPRYGVWCLPQRVVI